MDDHEELAALVAATSIAAVGLSTVAYDLLFDCRLYPSIAVHPGGPEHAAKVAFYLLEGADAQFESLFRYNKSEFRRLVHWIRNKDLLRDTKYQTVEQKLIVFIWIMAFGETQRNASNLFQMAQSTVSNIVQEVLAAMVVLHREVVRQPSQEYVSKEIELDHKNCQFNGCIGAIDGTLIAAHVAAASQKRFFNRKGFVSQNVFAAVTFDGLFSYVLAGAEGSMNDATLIRHAQSRSFDVPLGRYYLADAGFACERGIVTPFPGERYHLNETAGAGLRPTTAKELYNMWHARMRGIVEKVFGRLKRRWKITRSSPPEYSFADQIRIVYAVTALYNYQLLLEIEDDVLSEDQIDILRQAAERADRTVADFDGKVVRHNAAVWTWQERQQFVEALEEEENEQ